MAKKRKLTKEEKLEIKNRASLGRLCKPGCTLVVFGREMSAQARYQIYESGIRVVFTNDIAEVTEFLETAATMEIPMTLIIRSVFSENPVYFSVNVEPLLSYAGEFIDVKIFGHTPHDLILDRLGIREDGLDDRAFYSVISEWSPYCADKIGYGNRMKVLAANEKKAYEVREKTKIVPADVITTPHDPFELMEKLALCADTTGDSEGGLVASN